MIQFSDAPYQFFEAKPSPFLIRFGRVMNQRFFLPGPNHRIKEMVLDGAKEEIREAIAKGERLMFVINHPTHSDPQVVTELHRRLGVDSCFMAAYDVFLRHPVNAWVMQRMGNFSIDREGSDRKAMAAAIDVLKKGERALNIFPEGNVFLMNDRLAPFLDGAAFIAIKAQAALDGVPVKIVPISMKYTHLTTPREAVTRRMLDLGARSEYVFPAGSSSDPISAVMGMGRHMLARYLRAHGHADALKMEDASLYAVIGGFADKLMDDLEGALELSAAKAAGLSDRILKIRSRLHQLRTDRSAAPDPAFDGMAERAILALRIHGYLSPYLIERPTIDRYDETVERIAEDFHSKAMPRTGPRRVMIRVHPPVCVSDFISAAGGNTREAISKITQEMQQTIQKGIDALNDSNDAPGAEIVRRS
ncbi:MAG: lysophospholipid acyltransferase family protein [Akkermansiaceae bacterium]